jgi:hypothetical protein
MRDDFSKQIIETLAKRVGNRCSNPSCRKLTSGPHEDPSRALNIGVGAHIAAASPGGPRYDQNMTSEERQDTQNGIWLCQNCAKLIDNDIIRYNKQLLNQWKSRAEAHALSEVEGYNKGEIKPEGITEISISYKKIKIESERHDYQLWIELTNKSTVPLENYHVDVVIPTRIIENPERHRFIVRDRSSDTQSLFRFNNNKLHLRNVMPGDTALIMTFDYYMTYDIYFNRGDLFDQLVQATLYHYGFQPLTVEKAIKDLQIF